MPISAVPRFNLSWFWIRLVGGSAILAAVVWRLGTGPIVAGVQRLSLAAIMGAALITAATTGCSAWRWTLVARHFGLHLSLPAAVAAYYRSQFLNTALPGGILGDVSRAVGHGQQSGSLGRAVRSVAWDRSIGQLVQLVSTLVVLEALGWPARWLTGLIGLGVLLAFATTLGRFHSLRRELAALVRPGPLIASILVLVGHAAVLLIAFRVVGVSAPTSRLLALALLVLLATAIPVNLGGWGPREGAAAALFAGAGLSSAAGVSAAAADGVLVTLACFPGALVLVAGWLRRAHQRRKSVPSTPSMPTSSRVLIKGASGG